MRLKLIFENIKHHLSLSCFIILTFFVIITSSVLAIEITLFTHHVSSDKYHRIHNDFDIVIKSNTGLSLRGTRGEENEFDNSYDRRIGFYNVTLLAQTKNSSSVVSVYEGTNEDFNLAFNFNPYLNSDGIALTRSYAKKYNLKIGDQLTLNIGENKITYNVVSIVDPTGLVAGEYAFITGNNIAEKYAFKNMYNVILLDIKDSADYQTIYKNMANVYGSYTVKDINDQDIIKTLAHSTLSEMMIVFCGLFVLIIVILMNMLDQRLKRQENFFKIIDKRNYFVSNKLILYFVMVVLATILSIGFNHILFKILLKIYQCRVPYSVSFKSYLIALILPFIIIFLKVFIKINKKVLKRKYYLLSTIILFIVCLVLYIIFKNSKYDALLNICLIVSSILLVVELIFRLLKFILPFNTRVYIYDLGNKNYIFSILQLSYIFITLVIFIILSTFNVYSSQMDNFENLIKIDKAVISKYIIDENDKYEVIRISENGLILNRTVETILGVDSEGYHKYVDYENLTKEEQILFDSNDKYIILSKYFKNIYDLSIGDKITMTVNNKKEEFTILKFVNHVYKDLAIVNHSDYLYYGYVLNENNINENLLSDFSSSPYLIVNLKNTLLTYKETIDLMLSLIKYFLIGLILLVVLFSVYISYEEYSYNQATLKKMKLLGYSNQKMFKVSLIKLVYNLLLVLMLGTLIIIGVIKYLDDALILLKTIMYISFNLTILILSLVIAALSILVGYLYSVIKYRKIK